MIFFSLQRLKTHVIKKDVNPEWNQDLTLSITDPILPFKLVKKIAFMEMLRIIKKKKN